MGTPEFDYDAYTEEEHARLEAKLEKEWRKEYVALASREGWNIWDCTGSANGPWQICKFDEPDEGQGVLEEDAHAWLLVMRGTTPAHQWAREFIKEANPMEWMCMLDYLDAHPA